MSEGGGFSWRMLLILVFAGALLMDFYFRGYATLQNADKTEPPGGSVLGDSSVSGPPARSPTTGDSSVVARKDPLPSPMYYPYDPAEVYVARVVPLRYVDGVMPLERALSELNGPHGSGANLSNPSATYWDACGNFRLLLQRTPFEKGYMEFDNRPERLERRLRFHDQGSRRKWAKHENPLNIGIMTVASDVKKWSPLTRFMTYDAQQNRVDYCGYHGYDLIWEPSETNKDDARTGHWAKIIALYRWLPHYDWIMWMDMDALFMNYPIVIEDVIKRYTVDAGIPDVDLIIQKDLSDIIKIHSLNSGIFLIRNTPRSMEFLRAVYQTDTRRLVVQEQGAMDFLVNTERSKMPQFSVGNFVHILPQRSINSYYCETNIACDQRYRSGDWTIHFPMRGALRFHHCGLPTTAAGYFPLPTKRKHYKAYNNPHRPPSSDLELDDGR